MTEKKVKSPLQEFLDSESASGILLIIATVLALIAANSPLQNLYKEFLNIPVKFGILTLIIDKPLILWINDGMMAVFFLLIGLEIKREMSHGELSDFKSALPPIVAAFGGAVIPALIFFYFNSGTEFISGWGIPMATDIAFAIGILTLVGSGVPTWAKVFLTALAVVDDLIAIIVIAIFYTSELSIAALIVAAGSVLVLILLNVKGVHRLSPYILIGIILWIALLKSGVHATIAGVILGLLIPITKSGKEKDLVKNAEKGVNLLNESVSSADKKGKKELRETALNYLGDVIISSESPLHRLEHKLHPWSSFFIIPIFAFANAGVTFNSEIISQAVSSTLTWGIVLGLFFGKSIGIFGFTWILSKLGFTNSSEDKERWNTYLGLAFLGGIGFTMSLFISSLAFSNSEIVEMSKIGILLGSLISGIIGYIILKRIYKN